MEVDSSSRDGIWGRSLSAELEYWERYLSWRREEPQPILDATLEWLKENRYTPKHITLCWGDARMPNTIYSMNGDVLAIVDWEMAYLGDPESDLGFFLLLDWQHSEGYGIPRLEGSPGKEETVKHYEEFTGWKVENLLYNEVLAAFRAGIVILPMGETDNYDLRGATAACLSRQLRGQIISSTLLTTLGHTPGNQGPGTLYQHAAF